MGLIADFYGYTATDTSIFGASVVIFGLISSVVHSLLLDKHKQYKKQMIILSISTVISTYFIILILGVNNKWITNLGMAAFGASVVPVMGVGYSF